MGCSGPPAPEDLNGTAGVPPAVEADAEADSPAGADTDDAAAADPG